MFSTLIARIAPRYNRCSAGHSWTDRSYPVACRVCGRNQQSIRADSAVSEPVRRRAA